MSKEDSSEFFEMLDPGAFAERRLRRFEATWRPQRRLSSDQSVIRFNAADFDRGECLGQGSFSKVYAVSLRTQIIQRLDCHNNEHSNNAYALKQFKQSTIEDITVLRIASSDLVLETAILINLQHENIIRLYGMKDGNINQSLREGSFFILLDRLYDTLDIRLEKWHRANRLSLLSPLKSRSSHPTVEEKLKDVILGIARGLEYLHSRNIIFRDLKPANIGFDEFDTVKIFDFGLSRDCSVAEGPGDKPRIMTGCAGTPRYMAPEVFRMDQPYGFPADVYSFSILMWQIVANKRPFDSLNSMSIFAAKVVRGGKRPKLDCIESASLRRLLTASWSADPNLRPHFGAICCALEALIRRNEERSSDGRVGDEPKVQRTRAVSSPELQWNSIIMNAKATLKKSMSFREEKKGKNARGETSLDDVHEAETLGTHNDGGATAASMSSSSSRFSQLWRPLRRQHSMPRESRGISLVAERSRHKVALALEAEINCERREFEDWKHSEVKKRYSRK